MKTINEIIERLENLNITVDKYKEGKKLCGYELNTYTNAGVNQIVFIDFRDIEMNPKNPKHFIELFNERVNDIDIDEELRLHLEDVRYRNEIGAVIGATDFKEWKENLQNIFVNNDKTPQQRQFEQVQDKLRSQLAAMEETLLMMPRKGNNTATCQRTAISNQLGGLDMCINGIELEDFTPNEYSSDFKLSYS